MKPTLLRMREGKPGGGKGPLLSEDMSLTLTGVQDVLFQPMYFDVYNQSADKNTTGTLDRTSNHTILQHLPTPASSQASAASTSDSKPQTATAAAAMVS